MALLAARGASWLLVTILLLHSTTADLASDLAGLLERYPGINDTLRQLDARHQLDLGTLLDRIAASDSRPGSCGASAAEPSSVTNVKYLVVGAGPGGLQLGSLMEEASKDYLILERTPSAGSFFDTFPRHRKLISLNKRFAGQEDREFNWRHDWNSLLSDDDRLEFSKFSTRLFPHADSMVDYLRTFAELRKLNVMYNTTVEHVTKKGDTFVVRSATGATFHAEVLIWATGLALPNVPQGWEQIVQDQKLNVMDLADQVGRGWRGSDGEPFDIPVRHYSLGDTFINDDFKNKTVLILGKGNAAMETATALSEEAAHIVMMSRSPARRSWETHYVGDVRAVNSQPLDMYQLKSLVSLLDPSGPGATAAEQAEQLNPFSLIPALLEFVGGEWARLSELSVILCTGWKASLPLTEQYDPNSGGKYPKTGPGWQSLEHENLYYAGTNMHGRDWRVSSGGFVHGFRYTVRALFRGLMVRHEQQQWPGTIQLPSTARAIGSALLTRAGSSAGLYQMFKMLSDVVMISGPDASLHPELPLDQLPRVMQQAAAANQTDASGVVRAVVMTLRYGRCYSGANVWLQGRYCGQAACAAESNFLHPVFELWVWHPAEPMPTAPLREFHLFEDLYTRWTKPLYTMLLGNWLGRARWLMPANSSSWPVMKQGERNTTQPLPPCHHVREAELTWDSLSARVHGKRWDSHGGSLAGAEVPSMEQRLTEEQQMLQKHPALRSKLAKQLASRTK